MSPPSTSRLEVEALVDDLLHACLGAIEDEIQAPYDEGCRAIAELHLSPEDRAWVELNLARIGAHFDLRHNAAT